MITPRFPFVCLIVLLLMLPSESLGSGFAINEQSARALGMGGAFVAQADDPSAVYYNPAGITQLKGQHVSAGLYAITSGIEFTSAAGGTAKADSGLQFVPQLHYVLSPKGSDWSFGLGVNAPYGLSIDYGTDTPFSSIATKAKLLYVSISPVVAYKITPTLSHHLN